MRIAFVMPWHISERGGGAEVQANYLAQELAFRGFYVSYICQTQNKAKVGTVENINGFEICWLKASGRFPWLDQGKYYVALKNINPDAVLQRLSSNVSFPIGNYCRSNNKVFHWFCTDNESPFKNFHLKNFTQRFPFRIANGLKFIVFGLNALIMDFYRNRGMKDVNVAWSQNGFQKKQLLKNFKLNTHRMISGHPIPQIVMSQENRFHQQTVLWCGNLGKHKRPELFIDLAKKFQHTYIKFVMVGGHENQQYMNSLFKNKPENLNVVGRCAFDEALSFFDEASVLINTSTSEGFSNTYIQSWLRGVPTIVMGADPDSVIANNKLGYDCSTLNQLEEKLCFLLDNKTDFMTISRNAKEYAEQHHSIKIMADGFLTHIQA